MGLPDLAYHFSDLVTLPDKKEFAKTKIDCEVD